MYEYKVMIDRWVDGDTVDVDIDLGFDVVLKKQRVRLHGINAPESRTRDKEEKKRGLAAKDWLANQFYTEANIELHSKGKGKFGRVLGEFYIDDININQLMVDEGHAVEYYGGKR